MSHSSERKSIGDKYALDYYRFPLRMRAWKWPTGWLAVLLAILVVIVLYSLSGEKAFQAAPLSNVHASFNDSCNKCHDQAWQPAVRLVTTSEKARSVSNSSCQACHQAQGHQSKEHKAVPACVACHQEHRPELGLLQVADSQCVSCHADLQARGAAELVVQDNIETFSSGVGAHPEFALLRSAALAPEQSHGAWKVATVVGTEASRRWVDLGGVRFNHALHLAPEGVLNSERLPEVLTCNSCHQDSGDGQTMHPPDYQAHCAVCHPLRLAEPFSQLGNIPHESPEVVRGVLRERLSLLQRQTRVENSARERIPLLPAPPRLSEQQEKMVDELVAQAGHALFGLEAKGYCRKCHSVEARNDNWEILRYDPAILESDQLAGELETSAMIPKRWLSHGQFDHGRHRWMACQKCHQAATSTGTADILLPSIQICRQCHGSSASTIEHQAGGQCIECHDYHDAPSHWHNSSPDDFVSKVKE